MQLAENGKILTHVANNGVRQTTMSQASRDMGSGRLNVPARAFASEADRLAAVEDARREVAALGTERLRLQGRMTALNGRIRGRRLRQDEYDSVCTEQSQVIKLLADNQSAIDVAKAHLRRVSECTPEEKVAAQRTQAEWWSRIDAKLDDALDRLEWIERKLGRPFTRENDYGEPEPAGR